MIYALKGLLYKLEVGKVILNVNDVYYEVFVPNLLLEPVLGTSLFLYIHQVIREDDEYLIGFETLDAKLLFKELISVGGIGPKTALGILTATEASILKTAIQNENLAFLKKLPGVGPKTASQIILDLKGKLTITNDVEVSPFTEEVTSGLVTLGFKKPDIKKVLGKLDHNVDNANALFKAALVELRKL